MITENDGKNMKETETTPTEVTAAPIEADGVTSAVGCHLAYVARVHELRPIAGKDRIEVAVLGGWQCIVKRGEFAVGDLALYFAIGCVPDFDDPHFAFLREKGLKRIKTMKMGKVVSQGLLGPLQWMAERGHDISGLKEGDDVAAAMGVTKFVAAEEAAQYSNAGGAEREPFPSCVPKTDAVRLQHRPELYLSGIAGRQLVISRKEDGCSCSFVHHQGRVMTCSRNFVCPPADADNGSAWHYHRVAQALRVEEKLLALGRDVAVQGEIVGPKVSGNRLQLAELQFRVFDVFDIAAQRYLLHDEVTALCAALGLSQVPVLFRGSAAELELTVEAFLQRAEQVQYAAGVPGEGIVVKTADDASPAARVAFKVISNKYLLKHDL